MKILTFLFSAFVSFILITGCKPGTDSIEMSDPARYEGLVAGYTSGVVSSGTTVQVLLAKPIEGFQPGTELPSGVLSFKPAIKGKAVVEDAHSILIKPEMPLRQGQQYEATIHLSKLFEVPDELKTFIFKFQVITQDFTVFSGRMVSTESVDQSLYRYEGKILTADVMGIEEVSKLIRANSPQHNFEVKVSAEGLNTFVYLIEGIPRMELGYEMEISWDGKPLNIEKQGSFIIEVPSVNEFELLSFEVNQADQSVVLTFSDPLDNNQQISGLIRIENFDDVRLSRSGAMVTLFPNQRLQGEQRIIIDGSVRSREGIAIGETLQVIIAMEALKPQVEIIGNGNIVPDSKGLILPFRAVSLNALDVTVYKIFADNVRQFFQTNQISTGYSLNYVGRPVFMKTVRFDQNTDNDLSQWNAFSVDLTEMVRKDPMAIYQVKFSFKKDYARYDCLGADESEDVEQIELSEAEQDFWDGNSSWYNDWPANWNWRERDNPCNESYYTYERFPTRNIIASNLGILAKSADNRNYWVMVTDLLTTAPVGEAKVEFFNFQQQKLGEVTTSSTGMADIMLDNAPYLISATQGNQKSWLRVDNGSSLSLSNFDVSGNEVQKGIKGFIYGERGVWRPGDTLFLTFVMDDIGKKLPSNHPVLFELFDARGNMVHKQVKTEGVDNFYTFITPTKSEAPTGNWKVKVSVGGAIFERRLKVENVKPNRLKMDLNFNKEVLFAGDNSQQGQLRSDWLHGAPAAGLKAEVNLKLFQSNYQFKGYEKFTFGDPTKSYYPTENIIFSGQLNAKGTADIPLTLETNTWAPGMLNAVFTTRVFEKGGDFSTDVFTMPFAPFRNFTGLHIQGVKERRTLLETDTDQVIEVATLDYTGNLVSLNNLEMTVYKLSWRWWWGADSDNLAGWVSGQGSEVVKRQNFNTVNGKAKLTFRVDYPDWGNYFVKIYDPAGKHSSGMIVYFDWPSSYSRQGRQNPSAATMLSFSVDKEKYAPGEKAQVTFPSSAGARAMLTIETGTGILSNQWVDCHSGETTVDLDVTGEMAPNVYVYITMIQPYAQTANDLPIRMYGVIPVMVEDPETVLLPQIKTPESIRPESEYTIKISEKQSRAMTYTIAIVDEGLLGLTRFKTPDPWQSFYAREALGVKTWDLYDDVLGAYGGQLQKILAIGGDDALANLDDQKANRFKPVVTFAGPFTLKAGQEAVHKFNMSNYIGEVRVMVIAGKDGAWGTADKSIPVKQPLMLLPTLPRVLSPQEEVSLPVSVFAMDKSIKEVSVKVKTEGPIQLSGTEQQQLTFDDAGEKMVYFKMKASDRKGMAKIFTEARSGNETASASIEIEVVHPNPYISKVENYAMALGEQKLINMKFHGIEGTNSGKISISGLPSFDLEKNIHFLIHYPYGCLEQTISSALPQLFLEDVMILTEEQKKQTDRNIRAAIKKLQSYRMGNGRFSYWPGMNYISDWSSVYAGHFMVLAGQKGYIVSNNLANEWMDHQSKLALQFDPNSATLNFYSNTLTQAYRLYVLALAGRPAFSAMNRLRELPLLTREAGWRLAAAYAMAGRPEVAEMLIGQAEKTNPAVYSGYDETFGSSLRDQAMILETMVLINDKQRAFSLINRMASQYKSNSMTTQTAAFCIYSISRYAKMTGADNMLSFSYTLDGKTENIVSEQPVFIIDLGKITQTEKAFTFKNTANGDLFVTTTAIGQPSYGAEETTAENLKMTISYLTIDGKPLNIDQIKQGTDLVAEIRITNPGLSGDYKNMALSFTTPSGWEILNKRVQDIQSVKSESPYIYRDIRDDRVDTFFDLGVNQTATFRIEMNAAYAGKFYHPAASCQAMYDPSVYAVEKGRWVEVLR
ncbi:MAG: hypothetical protein IH598_13050 [Bacteroidales bacterium]|nr:hypothetical protein [Bacteroidales bacterium]